MINTSTLQPTMHTFAMGRNLLKAVADDPTPTPAPPAPPDAPDIDFTKIDTPEKAALTPAMNPAVVLAAVATFAYSFGSSAPMASALQLTMGDHTQGSLAYTLVADQQAQTVGLKGEGTLGDQAFAEKWTVDPQAPAITISGNIGNNVENLTVKPDQTQQAILVDGTIGDVEVHNTITFQKDAPEGQPSVIIDGTLGGVANHQELFYSQGTNQAQVAVKGSLGDKSSDSTITAQPQNPNDPSAQSFQMQASGNIAGTPFTLNGQFGPASK